MKKNLNYLATTALIFTLAVFVGCGGGTDTPDTPEEDPCGDNATLLVAGSAAVSTVTNPNGTNVTSDWSGFTLTFSGTEAGGSYTTSVSSLADASLANIWAPSGTWIFSGDNCTGVVISATNLLDRSASMSLSATSLTLTFDVDSQDTGRTFGIPGTWIFEFDF